MLFPRITLAFYGKIKWRTEDIYMDYIIKRNELSADSAYKNEWVLPNGIGGYASSSILGSMERKHHALLIASKNPPIDRWVLLAKIDEIVYANQQRISLVNQQYLASEDRSSVLKEFHLQEVPSFAYIHDDFKLVKHISPKYGCNCVAITYEIETFAKEISLHITPLFNHREHGVVSTKEDLTFDTEFEGQILRLTHSSGNRIYFYVSEGEYRKNEIVYSNPFRYRIDESTGDDRTDIHYQPYTIEIAISAFSSHKIEIICSDSEIPQISAFQVIQDNRIRLQNLQKTIGSNDDYFNRLVLASDAFVAYRKSTDSQTVLAGFPWFTDWGRDTMIAFEGLFLSTKRYAEAKSVLLSFSRYEKDGLIPNMFPDEGGEPLYNTVDASLWYIHAIYLYYLYTQDWFTVMNFLFPVMKSIIHHYQVGTHFNIKMDSDFLIHAGSGLDQVTWMDVRINGEVITPRHGKPVEINALWYNALLIMDFFDDSSDEYKLLSKKVYKNFNAKFWNKKTQCLYDVIDDYDSSIRPNQLFAISLPYSMLSIRRAKKIMKVVESELVDIYGIRTLAKSDIRFKPKYEGNIVERDHAYHMGTSWGFLMGPYLDSVMKTRYSLRKVHDILEQLEKHLHEGCINGYAEVFNGLNGIESKGCFTQAWSVAELIRIYAKYYEID